MRKVGSFNIIIQHMYLNPKVSNMLNEKTQEVISLELKIRMILSIIIIIQYFS